MYESTRGDLFGKEVKRRILLGTFTLSAGYYDAYYRKACQVRNLISQDFAKAFAKCDFLIGPTTPTVSFPIGGGGKKDDPVTMYLNDIYTVPVNLAGLPALSLPWGFSDGLPVGVQLIGPAFSEATLLRATAALEILHDAGGVA
jgi:aspartyl-tRNA(Asn)/glutamyl-tRNA(Gln) amidotransferase subunit A